jgi:O-acetyl-ADP-ribose deacetylase (regulator of RNase III)
VKVVQGDLLKLALDRQFDVILHGCNCFCQMGKGIALSIKQQFPEAYEADQATEKGDRGKLGTFTFANVVRLPAQFTLVNAYTQYHWRGQGVLADYSAIRSVFKAVREKFHGKRIGYPKIGAGLAKGDWNVISQIVDEELAGEDHTVVEFVPPAEKQVKSI